MIWTAMPWTKSPDGARRRPQEPELTLTMHGCLALLAAIVVTVGWAATDGGYFWPAWVWLGLGTSVAVHAIGRHLLLALDGLVRPLVVHAEATAWLCGTVVLVWGLAGGGEFWPIWSLLSLGTILAVHALYAVRDHLPAQRERELVERVDELSRTRRGALDVQAAELRRIERDLHDGAQARLVALSMQLGRAEDRLEDQPEIAALVRRARDEAGAAIKELRDLARGIAPPVLADRGLVAAVEALGQRAAPDVSVEGSVGRRLSPVIEAAAYFVVAEALTNVVKHAPGAAARVTMAVRDDVLVVEIADDGPGGAALAEGDGTRATGLAGMRHRIEALDGTLRVTSPAGVGTAIRAELPCIA